MPWYVWFVGETAFGVFLAAVALFAGREMQRLHKHYPRVDWTDWRWSQDGWVRIDRLTGKWQFGGDDYDGGPDDDGPIL